MYSEGDLRPVPETLFVEMRQRLIAELGGEDEVDIVPEEPVAGDDVRN